MAIIASIDGPNRRIYLHADTADAEVHPVDIYKEMRTFRRTDENLRKYDLFLKAEGYVSKGGGKFTPILVTCLDGTRIVPYDSTHTLTITGEIINDDGTSGLDCFDKTLLTPTSVVDINYFPPQVEVIEVVSGSGVTEQDKLDIADRVWDEILTGATHNIASSAGRRLRALGDIVTASVSDAGATADSFITDLTENRDEFYDDQLIRFTSGNLIGHVRPILSYDGTTKTITVSETMIEAPDDGSDFDIIPTHVHPITQISQGVWDNLTAQEIETMIAELHKLQGLLVGKPMTVTPTSRDVDDISQVISGDGETSTTVTRQP